MNKLKPCPFCVGQAAITKMIGKEWKEPYSVECRNCGAYKNDFVTADEAKNDWNKRV